MQHHQYGLRSNPASFGWLSPLGVALGVGGTLLGAGIARKLIARAVKSQAPTVGPGGVPPKWLAEVGAALDAGATVGSNQLAVSLPVAFLTVDDSDVEALLKYFPYATRPGPPLLLLGKEGTLVPLVYLYAGAQGEVGFRVDEEALVSRGVAYDVTAEATYADGTPAGARAQVDALVTNLSVGLADLAMREGRARVQQRGDDLSVAGGTRDGFVSDVLAEVVPSYDWSRAPAPGGAKWDSGPSMLWHGVSLVGQLAYQRAMTAG